MGTNLHTTYLANESLIKSLQIENHNIEMEWLTQMEADGATAIPGVCETVQRNTYDATAFTPLLEIFNEADLAQVWRPSHEERIWVEAKWKPTGTVKAMAKRYGTRALACIERAQIPSPPTVKVVRPTTGGSPDDADAAAPGPGVGVW